MDTVTVELTLEELYYLRNLAPRYAEHFEPWKEVADSVQRKLDQAATGKK